MIFHVLSSYLLYGNDTLVLKRFAWKSREAVNATLLQCRNTKIKKTYWCSIENAHTHKCTKTHKADCVAECNKVQQMVRADGVYLFIAHYYVTLPRNSTVTIRQVYCIALFAICLCNIFFMLMCLLKCKTKQRLKGYMKSLCINFFFHLFHVALSVYSFCKKLFF